MADKSVVVSQFREGVICTGIHTIFDKPGQFEVFFSLDGSSKDQYDVIVESPPQVGKKYRLVWQEMEDE